MILGSGLELTIEHLPPQLRGQSAPRPIRPRNTGDQTVLCTELVRQGISTAGPHANDLHDRIVGRVERELIQQVLQSCDRIQIKAAARLGINRNTLHKKLAEYRLDEAEPGSGVDSGAPTSGRHGRNGTTDDPDLDEPDADDSHFRPGPSAAEPTRPAHEA